MGVVEEEGFQDADEAAFECRFLDRDHEFDAFFEIACHPVGRGDVNSGIAAAVEVEKARVFEEAVDDGDDLDIFRVFWVAGFEAADAADVEADFDAGL